jgi:hypothetical protein
MPPMDAQHAGALVAAASGLLLLLAMFLPWFGIDASFTLPGGGPVTVDDRSFSAWEAFGVADLLLCVTGAAAIALAVLRTAGALPPGLALLALVVAAVLSALAIVYRLIDPPDLPLTQAEDVTYETGRRLGAFFGLLCTAGIAWGANRMALAPPARLVVPRRPLREWSRAEVDEECAAAWRRYDRSLGEHYAGYFERHPELRGEQRFSARDLGAAMPPGWGELAGLVGERDWQRHHLSGKSSQTLAVGLLGVAARREPTLEWLWDALGPLPPALDDAPSIDFEAKLDPDLLGESARQTSVDVLVDDLGAAICIETKWREPGVGTCSCGRDGGSPLQGRCARRAEGREAYWEAAEELFGLPRREPPGPCPLSPAYQAVRNAAAARALAGPERVGVFALVYDANNPYFRETGDWPGWPALLAAAAALNADPARFRFAAVSWQELVPRLPLDPETRAWAAEKHGL